MPMHDWTRVISGIFHHFHQAWITEIAATLNAGLLPTEFYALAEQVAEGPVPDVLTLERLTPDDDLREEWKPPNDADGGLAVAEYPPRAAYTLDAEQELYTQKANRVAVFHASGDRVVGYVEIVSPGNKHSESSVRKFLDKMEHAIERSCHQLIIDPHPPTVRDPQGLHSRFWMERVGQPESPGVTTDKPLGVMAYRTDTVPTAYFTPFAVGEPIPDMPLFLDPDHYVNVPLDQTYQQAWRTMPQRWKRVIEGQAT